MRDRKIVKKYLVHSPYKRIVNTMRYKRESYTARKILKSPTFCDATIQELMRTIRNECATLCKKTPSPSYLRVGTINDLFQFDWEPLLQELQEKAPLLMSVLKAASERSNRKPADVAVVGMAAAILLKSRCMHMCKMQMMTSSLLYSGHASKRVSTSAYHCNSLIIIVCLLVCRFFCDYIN